MAAHARSEAEAADNRYTIKKTCNVCEGWTTVFTDDGRLVECPDHWTGGEDDSEDGPS